MSPCACVGTTGGEGGRCELNCRLQDGEPRRYLEGGNLQVAASPCGGGEGDMHVFSLATVHIHR